MRCCICGSYTRFCHFSSCLAQRARETPCCPVDWFIMTFSIVNAVCGVWAYRPLVLRVSSNYRGNRQPYQTSIPSSPSRDDPSPHARPLYRLTSLTGHTFRISLMSILPFPPIHRPHRIRRRQFR